MHIDFNKYGSPLIQLAEELNECAVMCMKAERFGLDDLNPLKPHEGTCRSRLLAEMDDVKIKMLTLEAWLKEQPIDLNTKRLQNP